MSSRSMTSHAGPILCATDFSPAAARAADLAACAGRLLGRPLVLAHVLDVGPSDHEASPRSVSLADRLLHERVEARIAGTQRALEREAQRLRTDTASISVLVGRAFEATVAHARAIDASLIVVGGHGAAGARGAALGWLLGSTADRVVRAAPCPVLVVPATADATVLDRGRWIAGVAFDEISRHALAVTLELAARCGARVEAVHVTAGKGEIEAHDGPSAAEDEDERELATIAREARSRAGVGLAPDTSVVHGDPAGVLVASSAGAALIVVGTHARGAFTRAVLGSVAEAVLRVATTPVLVVPPLARDVGQRAIGRTIAT
jgi:nucleotide-binding universal stress UspA family protein